MQIVLVVYDGVLDDECVAFRSVLGLIDNASVVTTGARMGSYAGPGGHQIVDRTFEEIDRPDVVIVPGGIGCERAADDPQLRDFLHRMEGVATYIAGSSTGSVVLASAGLLHGEPAATHWLATDLLRRYGSESAGRRLVMTNNVITCEGRISAVDAAFTLVHRLVGPAAVEPIRATLLERGRPLLAEPSLWRRLTAPVLLRFRRRRPPTDRPPGPPVTPSSVLIELVPNDELRRRVKRNSRLGG